MKKALSIVSLCLSVILLNLLPIKGATSDTSTSQMDMLAKASGLAPLAVGTRVLLPIINVDNGWLTLVQVQNVGSSPTKVVMDLYGASNGKCPPQNIGLVGTECSGYLKPGVAWTFELKDKIGVKSAIIYAVVPGTEDPACGGNGARQPGQPLAVVVNRIGPDTSDSDTIVSSYTGNPIQMQEGFGYTTGTFQYYVPTILKGLSYSWNTDIWIQNAGDQCTSVEVWYQQQGYCEEWIVEQVGAIAPGETALASNDLPDNWVGSAWIKASQPLSIVVDEIGPGLMMCYRGVPADACEGSLINYAPLIYREHSGWDTGIQVQNLSTIVKASVKVHFLDNNGGIISAVEDQICPSGSQTFYLPAIDNLPGQYIGAVRIESQVWWDSASPPAELPYILSVVNLINHSTGQALSYNAFPTQQVVGIDSVVFPFLAKEMQDPFGPPGSTWTSKIAVQNLNPNPGQTSICINIYDHSKLIRSIHQNLRDLQVIYIDLSNIGDLPPNFSGSGILKIESSTQSGTPSVAAVVVERVTGYPSGDLAKAYEGLPIFLPTAQATVPATTPLAPATTMPSAEAKPSRDISWWATIATIIGTIAAIIALIPAFGAWLSKRKR